MKKTLLITINSRLINSLQDLRSDNITIMKPEDVTILDTNSISNIIIDRRSGISSKNIIKLRSEAMLNNVKFEIILPDDYDSLLVEVLKGIIKPLHEFKNTDRAKKLYNMMIDKATSHNEKITSANFLLSV